MINDLELLGEVPHSDLYDDTPERGVIGRFIDRILRRAPLEHTGEEKLHRAVFYDVPPDLDEIEQMDQVDLERLIKRGEATQLAIFGTGDEHTNMTMRRLEIQLPKFIVKDSPLERRVLDEAIARRTLATIKALLRENVFIGEKARGVNDVRKHNRLKGD